MLKYEDIKFREKELENQGCTEISAEVVLKVSFRINSYIGDRSLVDVKEEVRNAIRYKIRYNLYGHIQDAALKARANVIDAIRLCPTASYDDIRILSDLMIPLIDAGKEITSKPK